ncbi:SAM-dependent methyltransferase [Rhizobium sp. AG855]|uniref:SAM-dependent methyltransferase n=1 Tax=Rhizobium sp. AG855 TaxID=2183898 RepID=UPI000E732D87|nr:SAM-dependent methyltransferase [Rhizobium sp. AG855]RKE85853.1 tetrapyrrole (corrin/porphyrin) methylase-like protein [Rhizobium sp. AG855]
MDALVAEKPFDPIATRSEPPVKTGFLSVVGVGIKLAAQTSLEAKAHIEAADRVFYLVTDPGTEYWLTSLNPAAQSLQSFYEDRSSRLATYLDITEYILEHVRQGLHVCAVFYGHPGIFVFPSHRAVARARQEGFDAVMLPGISAEDCLFADLGVDPARKGCQSFEATDFLIFDRTFDPRNNLVLWQVGVLGEVGYKISLSQEKLEVLKEKLLKAYPADHPLTVYEAARYPVCDPTMLRTTIGELDASMISTISTLFIPPVAQRKPDLDIAKRLGIPEDFIKRRFELSDEEIERLGLD